MCTQDVSLDKTTVLTTIFTIVGDVMKASLSIQDGSYASRTVTTPK